MPRRATDHVYGPYRHGNKWRVVTKSGRTQSVASFQDETEANRVAAELRKALEVRTVDLAVTAYLDYLRVDKCRPAITISTLRNSITRMVGPTLNVTLRQFGAHRAAELYRGIATSGEFAADTHQNSLRDCRSAWRYFVKQGWVGANPFADVEPIGQRTKGKVQLRRDEARALLNHCAANLDDERAVVTLLCLLVAVRVGEIVALKGRDIDDAGMLLWVERGKTKNARRSLEVPEPLASALLARAREAGQLGRLFPYSRGWPSWQVLAMCEAAGVTELRGHALRGTHATLATMAGATSHMVASMLGHGSTAVTEAHYTKQSATDAATGARARATLALGNGNERSVTKPRKSR